MREGPKKKTQTLHAVIGEGFQSVLLLLLKSFLSADVNTAEEKPGNE